MAKPDPQGGLVFRYDYLWTSEVEDGREEGGKERPCAVVISLPATADGLRKVLACGITHSEPSPPDEGIEIPPRVKAHLGLDQERSWIIVSEVNLVDWEDPGIVPVAPGQWTYGFLPQALADATARRILELHEAKRLPLVNRPKIEERRAARDST